MLQLIRITEPCGPHSQLEVAVEGEKEAGEQLLRARIRSNIENFVNRHLVAMLMTFPFHILNSNGKAGHKFNVAV